MFRSELKGGKKDYNLRGGVRRPLCGDETSSESSSQKTRNGISSWVSKLSSLSARTPPQNVMSTVLETTTAGPLTHTSPTPEPDILSTTDSGERRKLYWTQAYKMLPEKYKIILENREIGREGLDEQFVNLKKLAFTKLPFRGAEEPNFKRIILRRRLHNFLRKVDQYCKFIDVAIQHHPEITALIWAGIRFTLNLALNDVRTFDAISTAIDDIPTVLCSCEEHDRIFFPQQAKNVLNSISPVYTACLKFTAEAVIYVRRQASERLLRGVVKSFEFEFQPLIEDIKDRKMWLEKLAMEAHQLATGNLLDINRRILQEFDSSKRSEILNSLSPVKSADHHDHARRNRVAGSGKWLLQKPDLVNWMESDRSSVFWLYGQAGAGKTVLSSIMVDTLIAKYLHCPVLFFYCNYKEDSRKQQESIVRTLYRDLVAFVSTSQLDENLVHEYNSWNSIGRRSSYLELNKVKELFLAEASKYHFISIVIDALDECDNVDDKLELVEYLVDKFLKDLKIRKSTCRVKIFLTSRHDNGIRKLLHGRLTYGINVNDTSEDIRPFVEARLTSMIKKGRLFSDYVSQEMRREIIDVLCEKAEGMFLWVVFQLQTISELANMNEVKEQLQELPEDVEATYRRMLDRINKKPRLARERAYRILMYIFGARSLLSPEEMVQAIAIPFGNTEVSQADFSSSPEYLVDLCCGLVVIDKSMRRSAAIRFIHFSVQEFLNPHFSNEEIYKRHPGFASLSQLFGCVCLNTIAIYHNMDDSSRRLLKKFYFYTLRNLQDYSDEVDQRSYDETVMQVKQVNFRLLIEDSFVEDSFVTFRRVNDTINERQLLEALVRSGHDWPVPLRMARVMAYYNLTTTFKRHIEAHVDMVSADTLGELLLISSLRGHIMVMQTLLNIDCNVSFEVAGLLPNSMLVALLHENPPDDTVSSESSADAKAQAGTNETLLHPAGSRGKSKLGNILVPCAFADVLGENYWATADVRDGNYERALDSLEYRWPVERRRTYEEVATPSVRRTEMVKMLADAGANVDMWGRWPRPTWLSEAHKESYLSPACEGKQKPMENFINGEDYGTPLQETAYRGEKTLVLTLLDASAQGGKYGTALQTAAIPGNEKVLQMPSDVGVDVNPRGRWYNETALEMAALLGWTLVQMLMPRADGAELRCKQQQIRILLLPC